MKLCPKDPTIKQFSEFLPDEVEFQKEAIANDEAEESEYDDEEESVEEEDEEKDEEEDEAARLE